jgi:hypothetical protein
VVDVVQGVDHFDPDDVIDRDPEIRKFENLVAAIAGPRLLTIEDEKYAGKTELLRLIRFHARYRLNPKLPATLVDLAGGKDRYQVLLEMGGHLADAGLRLKNYQRLLDARRVRDTEAFGIKRESPPIINVSVIDSDLGAGTIIAGATDPVFNRPPDDWTAGVDQKALDACMDAFWEDLEGATQDRSVVILLDQYESASPDVRAWMLSVLENRIFRDPGHYSGLVLVLACESRKMPMAELRGIIGDRFAELVCCVPELSKWDAVHVQQWVARLKLHLLPGEIAELPARLSKRPIGALKPIYIELSAVNE